jgi:tRNA threonylcarbamoyladenosine biosynthesis protein TsaB
MLIAVDTATRTASLALYDETNGWVLGEESWYSANNHTVELMPRLVRMVAQQGLSPADLTGLVVSLGPGSFTGLRIGLGVVKGLALAQNLPLVGVPTLDVVAQPHKDQRLPIWAVLHAGRGRVCAAYYTRDKGRWRRRGDYQLTTLPQLCQQVSEPALFCGEIDHKDAELLRERLGLLATVVSPAASLRRAADLAEMGWERLRRGSSDDVAGLSPIYLHHPSIDG